ncbi:unnamed protein product [Notodromas monacha]|uniref:RIMS-binding protein 2 n=1 Tax=Notodromas monacha TaxID=399045 RepID=A0A7R9BYP8_9CRUS|nr:unnamed protein product [Notodromas monacha]CAG0924138.1 unnamed protein product [Notodromas monacha]
MQSPNDNPESELPLTAGDYVLVWGDVDEDGFFDGELLTGRRGSVPSNFVERVTGNELCGLHKALLAGVMDAAMDDATINNKSALTNGLVRSTLSSDALSDFEQMLDDEIDADDDEVSDVPAPRMLVVERQLSNSVLIAWAAPAATDSRSVDCYRVFVDGDLQLTIGANERLKALLEGIDPARSHRISIRSVSLSKMSTEASCTMLVGRRVTSVPSRIRVSDVTSASALVTWLPANSNFSHVVRVNNVEVGTVKPGIYRHPVSGLAQNTDYTVSVRAKHETAVGEEARGGSDDTGCPVASISFVTLPKGRPKVSDHAVIDLSLLMRDVNVSSPNAPKQVTVKTKSKEGLSGDSVPALLTLPLVLAASVTANGRLRIANSGSSKGGLDQSLGDMTERSELSDIAEEPEESLSSSCSSSPSMDPIVSQQRNEIFEANNLPSQSAPGQKSSSGSGASSSPSAAAAFGSPDNGAASAAVSTENVADLRRTTQRRLFIATYDYDPATQSPNVDFSAELPFHQGDLITVC